jgi:solute carrier family 25 (peroxisomal adenine nucleotide transporter), member 17
MALTYPLITVSTRHQVQKSSSGKQAYKGQLDAFKKIIAEEGVTGLYSGLNSALFGIAITNGVYYYWYELVKASLLNGKSVVSTAESMASGAIAGTFHNHSIF